MSTLNFNCALITGGAGGLGRAFAENLIAKGKKVILAGRTESNLKSTAAEIKASAYYVLDTGDLDSIPAFVRRITKEHPDLDCLINNAGVQRPLVATETPTQEYIKKASEEAHINILGPIALILELLPHFKTQPNAAFMNVTSGLAYIPVAIVCPTYNGTKAYMHAWTLNLRTQLSQKDDTKHIKVVEIVPPMVTTDLHREHGDPKNNTKEGSNGMAMSVDEFIADVDDGWKKGDDTVAAGMAKGNVKKWFEAFGPSYEKFAH